MDGRLDAENVVLPVEEGVLLDVVFELEQDIGVGRVGGAKGPAVVIGQDPGAGGVR